MKSRRACAAALKSASSTLILEQERGSCWRVHSASAGEERLRACSPRQKGAVQPQNPPIWRSERFLTAAAWHCSIHSCRALPRPPAARSCNCGCPVVALQHLGQAAPPPSPSGALGDYAARLVPLLGAAASQPGGEAGGRVQWQAGRQPGPPGADRRRCRQG